MNTIERVDKIDEYLAMSDADKKEFERSNSVSRFAFLSDAQRLHGQRNIQEDHKRVFHSVC